MKHDENAIGVYNRCLLFIKLYLTKYLFLKFKQASPLALILYSNNHPGGAYSRGALINKIQIKGGDAYSSIYGILLFFRRSPDN